MVRLHSPRAALLCPLRAFPPTAQVRCENLCQASLPTKAFCLIDLVLAGSTRELFRLVIALPDSLVAPPIASSATSGSGKADLLTLRSPSPDVGFSRYPASFRYPTNRYTGSASRCRPSRIVRSQLAFIQRLSDIGRPRTTHAHTPPNLSSSSTARHVRD
jgi:hypothetical protein